MKQTGKNTPSDFVRTTFQPKILDKFGVAFLICSAAVTLFFADRRPDLHITLDISSSTSSQAQLFYDTGAGFNERESQTATVYSSAAGQFQSIAFPIPKTRILNLRFDPTTTAATVTLKDVFISGPAGFSCRIPPSDLKPFNQIRSRLQNGAQVTFSTISEASDPGIVLELHKPFDYEHALRAWRRNAMLLSIFISFAGIFLLLVFRRSVSRCFELLEAVCRRANSMCGALADRLSIADVIELNASAVWFYLFCCVTFLAMSLADLNGSSIAIYSGPYGMGAPQAAWLGSPRGIRSDEWAYATPDILHQSLRLHRFEVLDSARGGHSMALLDSVPVKHFTTVFRPQFWAFFFLPVDYAYAFYWQFKGFILITGIFTWLLFVTRSTFWSISGSLWFFFSPSTQWDYSWSTGLPEMVGLICLIMVSVCILLAAENSITIALASLVTACCAIDFALGSYVPHLVPLCWLAALFVLAWCLGRRELIFRRAAAGKRLLGVGAVFLLVGTVGVLVFADVRQAITGIANTDYPGHRVFSAASEKLVVFTSHFMPWTEKEAPLPPILFNICEAAGFLWLAPITLLCVGRMELDRFRKWALVALWLCSVLLLGWLLLPMPAEIGKILGLNKTGGARCVPALGLANMAIVALCMTSARKDCQSATRTRSRLQMFSQVIVILLAFFVVLQLTNDRLDAYFSQIAVSFAAVLSTILTLLILENRGRALAIILVASNAYAFGSINPIERGMGVITGSNLYKLVQGNTELLRGKWIVFSDRQELSGFVESVGCNTYTGMRFLPDVDHLSLFVSRGMNAQVFNNSTYLTAHAIGIQDKSYFEASVPGVTRWYVNPSDPILRTLGIKYVAFDQRPSGEIASGLIPIHDNSPVDKFWLYRLP